MSRTAVMYDRLHGNPLQAATEELYCLCLLNRVVGDERITVKRIFIVRNRLLRQEDGDVSEAFALAFGEAHTVHTGLIPVHVAYQDGTLAVTCSSR